MSAQTVDAPPWRMPIVGVEGLVSPPWQWWLSQIYDRCGGSVDKVEQAHAMAQAAAPQSTQVVAGGGLQLGGSLAGNVAVALYTVRTTVAKLPTHGVSEGDWAYALDGRKTGEAAGAGSGCPVWWSTPGGVGGWYTGAGVLVAA